jgi:uncharacterized membrane protein
MKNILGKVNSSANKLLAVLAASFVVAQNAFAAGGLEIPTGTDTTLIGYINDAFGVIIGVVIVLIAASIILKMLRKAGG